LGFAEDAASGKRLDFEGEGVGDLGQDGVMKKGRFEG
jgi:hypothetical protein